MTVTHGDRAHAGGSAPRHWFRWSTQERLFQVLLVVVLLVLGLLFLFPFYYMVLSSFREPFYNFDSTSLQLWPRTISLVGYKTIFETKIVGRTESSGAIVALARGLANTMFQEVFILTGSTFTALMAAYAFAKHQFHGRQFLFYLLLSGMIVPGEVTLIPKYVMFTNWGLIKTHWALIIPAVVGAGGWFLMRMFMSTIPNAYVDAARVDGASELRIVFDVLAPLSMPVILTNGLFTFLGVWNDLMGPLMYVNTPGKYTLQLWFYVIRYSFAYSPGDPTGLRVQTLFAAMILVSAPTVVVFLAFQRYITEGTIITGLKI
jgi:multiple sugar transport system permease protein